MISLLDFRLWLAVLLLAAASYYAGEWHEQERAAVVERAAKITLEKARAETKAAEIALASAHLKIDADRVKEKQDDKKTIDALRADVRSGAISLSIATRAIRASSSSVSSTPGDIETRSEIVPEAAVALIDIAADGDDAVRDLNACIAKYDAVRRRVNP